MLDEENDKRIKEAAEHYHPGYDDTAWEKMSQLLDEHLPQKKERKRIFFILPALLLVAVLVFFIVMNNDKKDSSNISQNVSQKNSTQKSLVETPVLHSKEKTSDLSTKPSKPSLPSDENKNADLLAAVSGNAKSVSSSQTNKEQTSFYHNNSTVKENDVKQPTVSETNAVDEKNKATSPVELKMEAENKNDSITAGTNQNTSKLKVAHQNIVAENEKGKAAPSIKKAKKINNPSFANNFGISISVGPDISGVNGNKIGRLTGIFGAGLNYSISKNISIRSGFYISKKIYSVDGNDYDLPGGNPNYAYLQNVSANCTVYEIPVKADYHFRRVKDHNWFVSTGLSSYLMKKENYDYYYKTVSGETYNKDWTINNKNKHFFSVLSFSGGYEYFFNKKFSFAAEPYINLPLKGIGVGKVKLNSGGILFTLKMKPFLKKEK